MIIKVGDKVIGKEIKKEKLFVKKVKSSKHLFRAFDAWGIDADYFDKALALGNYKIQIEDTETDIIYTTRANTFLSRGRRKNFGHGEQIFLSRKYFDVQNDKQEELF